MQHSPDLSTHACSTMILKSGVLKSRNLCSPHWFDCTYNRTICTCLEDLEHRPGKLAVGAHSNAISMLSTIKRSRLQWSGLWLSASSRSCLHRSDWLTCALICASRFDIIVPCFCLRDLDHFEWIVNDVYVQWTPTCRGFRGLIASHVANIFCIHLAKLLQKILASRNPTHRIQGDMQLRILKLSKWISKWKQSE